FVFVDLDLEKEVGNRLVGRLGFGLNGIRLYRGSGFLLRWRRRDGLGRGGGGNWFVAIFDVDLELFGALAAGRRIVVAIDLELVALGCSRDSCYFGGIRLGVDGRLDCADLSDLRDSQLHSTDRQLVTRLEDTLAIDFLAIDEGPVGTP